MNNQMQPIFVLPESALRSTGKNAQQANIAAAKAVSDIVRTTLGPKGMDKMLVDSLGDIVITNDGVTILNEMEIEHPAAKMIVEIAKVQEAEVGDGTTTAVILGGELLKKAGELLEKNIHPTVIASGYRLAAKKAQDILLKLGRDVSAKDESILRQVAITALKSKNIGNRETIADLAMEAVMHVIEKQNGKALVDLENVKIEKKAGGISTDTRLIKGVVIDKDRVNASMPRAIKNAKILLLDLALEIKSTETDSKIRVTAPDQLDAFIEQEEKRLKDMAEKVKKSGANVVVCQKGIDDLVQHYLAKAGIYAVRRVKQSDMVQLSKATGAKILSSLDEISKEELGCAGLVEERKLGDENMTFIEACDNPKAVTIIIRGGTEHVIDEVERALKDSLGDLAAAISVGKCVPGGGAIEIELSRQLRKFSQSLPSREQLAVNAFAEALEVIPVTLAENAGLDPIDTLTDIKAKHDEGAVEAGLDVFTGKTANMWKLGVIEPLKIKTQAVQSASDAAIMLLRIDDIVSAGKPSMPSMPPGGGMPPGMGGDMGY